MKKGGPGPKAYKVADAVRKRFASGMSCLAHGEIVVQVPDLSNCAQ